jgi:hypothetical protein
MTRDPVVGTDKSVAILRCRRQLKAAVWGSVEDANFALASRMGGQSFFVTRNTSFDGRGLVPIRGKTNRARTEL